MTKQPCKDFWHSLSVIVCIKLETTSAYIYFHRHLYIKLMTSIIDGSFRMSFQWKNHKILDTIHNFALSMILPSNGATLNHVFLQIMQTVERFIPLNCRIPLYILYEVSLSYIHSLNSSTAFMDYCVDTKQPLGLNWA